MNHIQLRPARHDDVDAIRACVDAAYRHYIRRIGKPPGPMLDDYTARVEAGRVWVADLDGEVLGIIVLIPSDGHLALDNIAVHPHAQGRGIGKRLMAFADREANRQGFAELRLYTQHQDDREYRTLSLPRVG